jgi:hypothetical protein
LILLYSSSLFIFTKTLKALLSPHLLIETSNRSISSQLNLLSFLLITISFSLWLLNKSLKAVLFVVSLSNFDIVSYFSLIFSWDFSDSACDFSSGSKLLFKYNQPLLIRAKTFLHSKAIMSRATEKDKAMLAQPFKVDFHWEGKLKFCGSFNISAK